MSFYTITFDIFDYHYGFYGCSLEAFNKRIAIKRAKKYIKFLFGKEILKKAKVLEVILEKDSKSIKGFDVTQVFVDDLEKIRI